jgi:hypothetical protein
VPRLELAMSALTLAALATLPSGRPLVSAAYAITVCLGFTALCAYACLGERLRRRVG